MRTIRLQIAATETHCEHNGALCNFLEFEGNGPLCMAFDGSNGEPEMDAKRAGYLKQCGIPLNQMHLNAPTEAQKEQRGEEG